MCHSYNTDLDTTGVLYIVSHSWVQPQMACCKVWYLQFLDMISLPQHAHSHPVFFHRYRYWHVNLMLYQQCHLHTRLNFMCVLVKHFSHVLGRNMQWIYMNISLNVALLSRASGIFLHNLTCIQSAFNNTGWSLERFGVLHIHNRKKKEQKPSWILRMCVKSNNLHLINIWY